MTTLLDGKRIAADIRAQVITDVDSLKNRDIEPTLALVVATDDESAAWYIRSLEKAAEKVGMATRLVALSAHATECDLRAELARLAVDPSIHGIILGSPLPKGVHTDVLFSAIPPEKDVDGANPLSAGRVMAGLPAFAPATASAVMELLETYGVPLNGTRAVVVGRSMVVGKPVAHLLLAANATVTICHSRTQDLAEVTRQADVLVVAIGKPRFLGSDYVKPGATVIDVGTTPDDDGKLVGDVDANAVQVVAGALTPVPGGVGPVTTALLLKNTALAATLASGQ
ncbi:MAG: bifunctional 5,10-methylenetetrahydrofolate dehydrogenase/5,10-methenyltetrahydrofolate cyclohydrolase [Egibacteraceae bacterium]